MGVKVSEERVYEALKEVFDPELGINIVDLGLVYGLDLSGDGIRVEYTLTYPGCPLGDQIRQDITTVLWSRLGVPRITAELVWEPLWGPERMSEEARISLGYPI